ncbi:MAG TPA: hypothetical protein VNG90_04280 [Candidatus Acidoferrum sp.]|nr:hypothetical protein [Candidatus Acidoferrum sp.]
MATGAELRRLAKNRLLTAKHLIDAQDWEMAVYMMALTLELALKSASCYALKLESYPETNDPNDGYFKTHNFDRLLKISGLTDIFSVRKPMVNQDAFDNWGKFTGAFLFSEKDRDYTAMRYDVKMLANFNEAKAQELHTALYEDKNSILKAMTSNNRW